MKTWTYPKPIWLHFNRFAAKKGDRETWTVRYGRRNYYTHKVYIFTTLETIYRGDSAPQPRAYLRTEGRIEVRPDGTIAIYGRA